MSHDLNIAEPSEGKFSKTLKKIFIIDDDDETLLLLKESLGKDLQVFCASSDSEFQLLLNQVVPDIVLVDINLSEYDGFYYIQKLREKNNAIVSIVMSGTASKKNLYKGIINQVNDFIEKPIDFGELKKTVLAASDSLKEKASKLPDNDTMQALNLELNAGELVKILTGSMLNIQFFAAEALKNIAEGKSESLCDSVLQLTSLTEKAKEQIGKLSQDSLFLQKKPERVSFVLMFNESYSVFAAIIARLNIQVIQIDKNNDALIYCDPLEIEHLLINLISNSVNSVAKSSVRWIKFSLEVKNKNIIFTLEDSRMQRNKYSIFSRLQDFFLKDAEKDLEDNTTLCHKIVEKYKGQLSRSGRGICKLSLPCFDS